MEYTTPVVAEEEPNSAEMLAILTLIQNSQILIIDSVYIEFFSMVHEFTKQGIGVTTTNALLVSLIKEVLD